MKLRSLTTLACMAYALLCNLSAHANTCPAASEIKVNCTKPIVLTKEIVEETVLKYIHRPKLRPLDLRYKKYVLENLNNHGFSDIMKKINQKGFSFDYNYDSLCDVIEAQLWRLGNSWETVLAIADDLYSKQSGTCTYTNSNLNSNFRVAFAEKKWLEARLKKAVYRGSWFISEIADDPTKQGYLMSCEYLLGNKKEISFDSGKQLSSYSNLPIVAYTKLHANYANRWMPSKRPGEENKSYVCKSNKNEISECPFE